MTSFDLKDLSKIVIAGMITILVVSCTEVEHLTPTTMAYGRWEVVDFYVDGGSNAVNVIERIVLDDDKRFLLEDQNGILTAGTRSATDTQLSLNGSNGDTFTLTIVFQSMIKMHLTQEVSSPTEGSFTITYLFEKT